MNRKETTRKEPTHKKKRIKKPTIAGNTEKMDTWRQQDRKPRQQRKLKKTRQEHYDMNMKQKPDTARNARKNTPNTTQLVRKVI